MRVRVEDGAANVTNGALNLTPYMTVAAPPPGPSVTASQPSNGFAQLVKAMAQAAQSSAPEIHRQDIGRMALDAATMSEEPSQGRRRADDGAGEGREHESRKAESPDASADPRIGHW